MPRRREVPKRKILPESKYGDETLAKFMNNLMMRGKKSVAERIVYDALDLLKAKSNEEDALAVFKKAIEQLHDEYIQLWVQSDQDDKAFRESMHTAVKLLPEIEKHLRIIIEKGKITKTNLSRIRKVMV